MDQVRPAEGGKSVAMQQAVQPVTRKTGFPVTVIDKKNSLGLTWANIGPIFRLPGHASAQQFLATGMALSVRVVGGEMDFPRSSRAAATGLRRGVCSGCPLFEPARFR
jgi:hypothetical protein